MGNSCTSGKVVSVKGRKNHKLSVQTTDEIVEVFDLSNMDSQEIIKRKAVQIRSQKLQIGQSNYGNQEQSQTTLKKIYDSRVNNIIKYELNQYENWQKGQRDIFISEKVRNKIQEIQDEEAEVADFESIKEVNEEEEISTY